jgi:hypothetical protein
VAKVAYKTAPSPPPSGLSPSTNIIKRLEWRNKQEKIETKGLLDNTTKFAVLDRKKFNITLRNEFRLGIIK